MADENKNPQEDIEQVAKQEEGVPVTPEYKPEGEAQQLEPKTPLEAGVQGLMETGEAVQDSPVIETFDNAVKGIMHAAEELVEGDQTIIEHHYSDTFAVPFYGNMTLPGGIYTFVFLVLGVLTLIEVLISFVDIVQVRIVVLLAIAFAKALLVIAFYMHLNRDNWLFRFVLAVPFFITLVSVLYLLGVPPTGYSIFAN